ncbi:MAG: PAS domain S-box protein [Henriciella sp.]
MSRSSFTPLKKLSEWFESHSRAYSAYFLVVFALSIVALATLAIEFTREQGRIAAIWPVNGTVLAIMLWRSRAAWPYMLGALAVALLAANMLVGDSPLLAGFLSLANAVEVFLVASLFSLGRRATLVSQTGLLKLIGAAAVGCLASTILAVTGLAMAGSTVLLHDAAIWFIADTLGIILFTPVVRGIIRRSNNLDVFQFGREQVLTFALACAVAFMVFAQSEYPFLFFVPAALVVVAFTSGIRGSAISLLATTAISLPFALADQGPTSLMDADFETKVLVLLAFLIVNSVLTLAVAGAVTERRRLLSHLQRSQTRLKTKTRELKEMLGKARLAEDMSKVGHWTLDPITNDVFWSPEVYVIHGVEPGEFDPNYGDAIAFFEESDRDRIDAIINQGMEAGEGWEFETTLVRKSDGERRHVHSIADCLKDAQGNVETFFGVFRDVTEQKRIQKEIREREARYRLLAEHSTDIVVHFDLDGIVRFVSPSCRMLGISPEDAVGKSAADFVIPEDRQKAADAIRELMSSSDPNRSFRSEHRAPRAGGGYIWLESSPTLLRDENGVPQSVVSSYRDVTERKRMEEQIHESERQYRMLAEHSTDIVLKTTVGGIITYASPSCAKLGVTPNEAIGMRVMDFVVPEDRERAIRLSKMNFAGIEPGPEERREYRVIGQDGESIWLEGSPNLIRDENGHPISVINTLRDVTERREREDMLAAAREEAESATRAKAEFLSNMSHEIRTPLNGVLGFTQLIARTDLDPDQKVYLERIQGAGRMLREIVDEILDFSKIEAGRLELDESAFCLRGVVDEVVDIVDAGRKTKSVPIRNNINPFMDLNILGDETRVRQVLLNLIGNAAKFTTKGQIDVRAVATGGTLSIIVEDTGIGISPENLRHVFEGFRQADSTISRKFGGTGLGLSISRSLAELMGGKLTMESEEGKGTMVTFTLPLKKAPTFTGPAPREPMHAKPSGRATIVVVDDVEANLSLIELGLKHAGHHLVTFESARKAVDFIREAEQVDLVLMDIQMPGMDGVAATRAIRALPKPNCNVPIIALTANALSSQIESYKAAGMNDHFAKPIDLDRLERFVARHVAAPQADAEAAEPETEDSLDAVMAELRAEYCAYLKSLRDEFETLLALSDHGEMVHQVARLAHSVAGTAGSYGFDEVSKAAFELEKCANAVTEEKTAAAELQAGIQTLMEASEQAA